MKHAGLILRFALASLIGLLAYTCTSPFQTLQDTALVTIASGLQPRAQQSRVITNADVASFRLSVTAADMPAMETSFTDSSIRVRVPGGTKRQFTLEAMNAAGIILYSGSTTADLESNDKVSLKISMARQSYTVTFDSVGGSEVKPISAPSAEPITPPPAPTKDKLDFFTWYKDTDYTKVWDFATDVVSGDLTLYAKWNQPGELTVLSFGFRNIKGETLYHGPLIGVNVPAGTNLASVTPVLDFTGARAVLIDEDKKEYSLPASAPMDFTKQYDLVLHSNDGSSKSYYVGAVTDSVFLTGTTDLPEGTRADIWLTTDKHDLDSLDSEFGGLMISPYWAAVVPKQPVSVDYWVYVLDTYDALKLWSSKSRQRLKTTVKAQSSHVSDLKIAASELEKITMLMYVHNEAAPLVDPIFILEPEKTVVRHPWQAPDGTPIGGWHEVNPLTQKSVAQYPSGANYMVTAKDTMFVIDTAAPTVASITDFSIAVGGVSYDSMIIGNEIIVVVPDSVAPGALEALTPQITHDGDTISPDPATPANFNGTAVTYSVTKGGNSYAYEVRVIRAASSMRGNLTGVPSGTSALGIMLIGEDGSPLEAESMGITTTDEWLIWSETQNGIWVYLGFFDPDSANSTAILRTEQMVELQGHTAGPTIDYASLQEYNMMVYVIDEQLSYVRYARAGEVALPYLYDFYTPGYDAAALVAWHTDPDFSQGTSYQPGGSFGLGSEPAVFYARFDEISPYLGLIKYVPSGRLQRDDDGQNTSMVSGFRMGESPVTRAQFASVMDGADPSDSGRSSNGAASPDDPVQNLNWYQAIAFCNILSVQEGLEPVYTVAGVSDWANLQFGDIPVGQDSNWDAATASFSANGYRLPTEMEWLWAAMGATKDSTAYWIEDLNTTGFFKGYAGSQESGNDQVNISDYAWYDTSTTAPVMQRMPNELGLYDLSGNVWEWCWDWSDPYPSGAADYYSGPVSGTERVVRGGAFSSAATLLLLNYRTGLYPYNGYEDCGLRVVRSLQGL